MHRHLLLLHRVFLAVLLALGFLALSESERAHADAPRLLKTLSRDEVWLVAQGQRHWITDLATFRARGFRWDDVELVAPYVLQSIPIGPAVSDGLLVRDSVSGRIYLIVGDKRRHVPDLVTFTLYGLDWSRVTPVAPAELGRWRPGPPLPLAVTGWPPPTITEPPLPAVPSARRAAPREVDPAFVPALAVLRTYPPMQQWPDFLERAGIPLVFERLEGRGVLGAYNPETNRLAVSSDLRGESPQVLAAILAHETVHAIYAHRTGERTTGRACIREEELAFGWQAALWAFLYGPGGKPDPVTELEQEQNRILRLALDDSLDAAFITHFTYKLRCYFPQLRPRPGEE
jgi:hypothetical protein